MAIFILVHYLFFHVHHAYHVTMPFHACFMLSTLCHACLWSPQHETLPLSLNVWCCFLSISVFMRVSCCPLFFMLRPLFSLKQDTMVFYSFHTWTLLFTSCHLVDHSVSNFGWKIEEAYCIFHVFHACMARVSLACEEDNMCHPVNH